MVNIRRKSGHAATLRIMALRDDIGDGDGEDGNPFAGYWMEGDSLAPPCQTDGDVIQSILSLANLSPDDYFVDLGCGDGRICIAASSRHGCRSYGVEIEDVLVAAFRKNIIDSAMSHLVTAVHGDLTEFDLKSASVIVLYLLPESIELIRPKLISALQGGARIICHTWGLKGARPIQRISCGEWSNVTLQLFTSESLLTADT